MQSLISKQNHKVRNIQQALIYCFRPMKYQFPFGLSLSKWTS